VPLILAPAANFLSTTTQNTGAYAWRTLQYAFDVSEAPLAKARAARMMVSGSGLKIENVSMEFEGELDEDVALLLSKDCRRGSDDSGWFELVEDTNDNTPRTETVSLKTFSVLAATSREPGIKLSSTGGCNGLK
jgi:hypothetical protein